MTAADASDAVLRGYFDALLQDPLPPVPAAVQPPPEPAWQACSLGGLQLLLPGDVVGPPIDAGEIAGPAVNMAHVRVRNSERRVLDLARCIAPGLPNATTDTLLPVIGSCWLLAVPGRPVPAHVPRDAIVWRARRNSRPWLAGMSRDGRHAVLDVHALIAQAGGSTDTTLEESSP